jgi:hypothetical protein
METVSTSEEMEAPLKLYIPQEDKANKHMA